MFPLQPLVVGQGIGGIGLDRLAQQLVGLRQLAAPLTQRRQVDPDGGIGCASRQQLSVNGFGSFMVAAAK